MGQPSQFAKVEVNVITPLGIPLVLRDERVYLGDLDITPMVKSLSFDRPEPFTTWADPFDPRRPHPMRPMDVTLKINVERIDVSVTKEGVAS